MTESTILKAGDTAPNFELRGTESGETRTYRLSYFTDTGQWVFLTSYAFDFNPVCTGGMCALRDAEFFEFYDDLAILGVSGDGVHAHERFADQHDINFPLLSDTSKEVAEQYGILRAEHDGMRRVHKRAVFLIDDTRTVRFATTIDAEEPADIDLDPINGVLRELRG